MDTSDGRDILLMYLVPCNYTLKIVKIVHIAYFTTLKKKNF